MHAAAPDIPLIAQANAGVPLRRRQADLRRHARMCVAAYADRIKCNGIAHWRLLRQRPGAISAADAPGARRHSRAGGDAVQPSLRQGAA